jgi:hypothetical protein
MSGYILVQKLLHTIYIHREIEVSNYLSVSKISLYTENDELKNFD